MTFPNCLCPLCGRPNSTICLAERSLEFAVVRKGGFLSSLESVPCRGKVAWEAAIEFFNLLLGGLRQKIELDYTQSLLVNNKELEEFGGSSGHVAGIKTNVVNIKSKRVPSYVLAQPALGAFRDGNYSARFHFRKAPKTYSNFIGIAYFFRLDFHFCKNFGYIYKYFILINATSYLVTQERQSAYTGLMLADANLLSYGICSNDRGYNGEAPSDEALVSTKPLLQTAHGQNRGTSVGTGVCRGDCNAQIESYDGDTNYPRTNCQSGSITHGRPQSFRVSPQEYNFDRWDCYSPVDVAIGDVDVSSRYLTAGSPRRRANRACRCGEPA